MLFTIFFIFGKHPMYMFISDGEINNPFRVNIMRSPVMIAGYIIMSPIVSGTKYFITALMAMTKIVHNAVWM